MKMESFMRYLPRTQIPRFDVDILKTIVGYPVLNTIAPYMSQGNTNQSQSNSCLLLRTSLIFHKSPAHRPASVSVCQTNTEVTHGTAAVSSSSSSSSSFLVKRAHASPVSSQVATAPAQGQESGAGHRHHKSREGQAKHTGLPETVYATSEERLSDVSNVLLIYSGCWS